MNRKIPLYAPARRRARIFGGVLMGVVVGALPAALAGMLATGASEGFNGWVVLAVLLPFLALFGWLLTRRLADITIASDGLSWKKGSERRYIEFDQLESVEVKQYELPTERWRSESMWAITLALANGTKEELGDFEHFLQAEPVAEAISAAKAAWSADRPPVPGLGALENVGESVSAWITSLRNLAEADTSYRTTTLTEDQLAEIVDDGAARPVHRVAAAVVLATKDRHAGRDRIRIAAEATANPKLRIALTSIANDEIEDSALEEAIAEERAQA
jgi:hypothetical protein